MQLLDLPSIARSSLRPSSDSETAHQYFSYPPTSGSPTVLAEADGHIGAMNTERTVFLDQLTEAIDAGDGRAAAILPMFQDWLIDLMRDPEAAKHEPGSVGYVARMFALRHLAEAAG